MRPEERDGAFLWDMLAAAHDVQKIAGALTLEAFQSDIVRMRATERCLEIIGEAARRVSKEFQQSHADIPWSDIIGQRNILAHEYGQIDYELLYKTVVEDIPQLVSLLQGLLPSE
jgi:uncharacterized protein with HEPN domain